MYKTFAEAPKTLTELGGILLNWLQMSKQIKDPVISLSEREFTVTGRSLFFNQGRRATVIRLTIAPDGRFYSHLENVHDYLPVEAPPLVKVINRLHKLEIATS